MRRRVPAPAGSVGCQEPERPPQYRLPTGRVLAVLCIVQFMLVLDVAVAAVALVPIQREFAVPAADLQWVSTAYGLTFGGLLILGGRLADVLGNRRMLQAGLVTFTVASIACGAAQESWQLFAARAGQGLGAAICSPAALAVLLRLSPKARRGTMPWGSGEQWARRAP